MVLTNGDISVFYPNNLNDCTELQLELYKQSQLEQKKLSEFCVSFLASCCSAEAWAALNKDHSADSLADNALTLAEKFIQAKSPLTRMPYGLLYLGNSDRVIGRKWNKVAMRYQMVDSSSSIHETLRGPEEYLKGLCFGQFVDAELYLFSFMLKKDINYLVKLAATIYRPVGEKLYNSEATIHYLKPIRKTLTDTQLYVILEYYLGSRKVMEQRFPNTFPTVSPSDSRGQSSPARPEGGEAEEQSPKKDSLTSRGIGLMYLGYHAKMVKWAGTPDKKKEQYLVPVYTALEFIEADIKEYKRREKEIADFNRKNKHAA